MAIYQPALFLSEADREALALLGQLVLASEDCTGGNIEPNAVALSPSEAARLLKLLEHFAVSKLFIEGSYFVEGMANGQADTDERLRGIYFGWRARRGFTNVMSNQRWREFVLRAGFNSSGDAWMWPHSLQRSPLKPMKLEHFVEMEARLATSARLHPRVKMLVILFVEQMLPSLQEIRDRKLLIEQGSLDRSLRSFITDLSDHVRGREKTPMRRRRVIAISTIIMDTAALFATRDWTAAGVLSALAAVVPDAICQLDD